MHFSKLQRIEHSRRITEKTDDGFLYQVKSALLLAFRERGILNAMQHRQAEQMLKQQRITRAKKRLEQE